MQSAVPILSLLVIFAVINGTNTYDDCDGVWNCGTNEKCKMYNDEPICLCKHGYKKNSNMECVKDKTDDCRYVTCGTNEKCKMYNNYPICPCKDGYEIDSSSKACVKSRNACDDITCGTNEKCTIRNDQPTCWCKDGYVKNPRTGECVSEGMFAYAKQFVSNIIHIFI